MLLPVPTAFRAEPVIMTTPRREPTSLASMSGALAEALGAGDILILEHLDRLNQGAFYHAPQHQHLIL